MGAWKIVEWLGGGLSWLNLNKLAILLFLVSILPKAINATIWVLYWLFKILFFVFGWILPARVIGDKIRFREFGLEYYIIVPISTILWNRYGPSGLTDYIRKQSSGLYDLAMNYYPEKLNEPLNFISSHLSNMEVFIPMLVILTLVKMVQTVKLTFESAVLYVILPTSAIAVAYSYGLFDPQIQMFLEYYNYDKNQTIAFVLLAWFIPIFVYTFFFETYDYYPATGELFKVSGTMITRENDEYSRVYAQIENWFRFIILFGNVDLLVSDIEAPINHVRTSFNEKRNNFGLFFALSCWCLFFKYVPLNSKKVGNVATKRRNIFKKAKPTVASVEAQTNASSEVKTESSPQLESSQAEPSSSSNTQAVDKKIPLGQRVLGWFKKKPA